MLVFCALAVPQQQVQADSDITAYDLISLVNSIRTGSYGLPALVVNSYLMSAAQWTAETMAAMNADGHLAYLGYADASVRAANTGFGGGKKVFVTENWAAGYKASLSDIQGWWADELHMYPMTKSEYMYIGAGVAQTSDGKTYYIVQAGYISGESVAATSDVTYSGTAAATSVASNNWVAAVSTSTPGANDGYIHHIVQTNQMLSDIATAYGVSVQSIVDLNGLSSADAIYAGQNLKIMFAPTPTATLTPTPTEQYPTHTPTTNATPTPLHTRTPTPKPSLIQQLPKLDRPTFGLLLVVISFLGLALMIFINFIKPAKKTNKPVEPEPAAEPEVKSKKGTPKLAPKEPAKATGKPAGGKPAAKKPASGTTKKQAGKTTPDSGPLSLNIPVKTSRKTTKKLSNRPG